MKSFTIYEEYYDLITLLTEEEQAHVSLALLKYMFEDIEIDLAEREKKVFINLKRPLDKSKNQSKNVTKRYTNEDTNEDTKEGTKEGTQSKMYMSMSNVNVNVNNLEKIECEEGKPLVTDDTSSLAEITKKVLEHLNNTTNSNFRTTAKSTQQKINARLNEGYKLDDFIAVIDKKWMEWKNTEFEKYMCPETLFGTKFEKYLNQKDNVRKLTTKDITTVSVIKDFFGGNK